MTEVEFRVLITHRVWLQNIGNTLKGAEPASLDIFNNTLPKLNPNREPHAISAVIHRQKLKL